MILRVSVLTGAAIGVVSAMYFLSLVVGAGPWVPLVVSAAICVALIMWARQPAKTPSQTPLTAWLAAIFLVVLAAAVTAFVMLAVKEPHGDWDAWSIWNLHARFLERGGSSQWTALFSKQLNWSYPDYPLLLPAFVAQIWSVLHSESTVVPILVAFLFTFGTVAALIGGVRQVRTAGEALIGGACLLGSTTFIVLGVAQYADVPLSFYIVAALALLCLEDTKSTILSGTMAAFAAWTKNEGLLFIVILIAARAIARWRAGKLPAFARELTQFAIGAAPILAVVALFKIRYAPSNELLFSHSPRELLSHALDLGRYITVIEALVKSIFQVGEMLLPAVLILAAYAWLVRFKIEPDHRMAIETAITTVLLMLTADAAVYVLLPTDLAGTINGTFSRVFTQIWPAALLAFFWSTGHLDLQAKPEPPKKHHHHKPATRSR